MKLLTKRIQPLYARYWAAAFGSALITCAYSIVDVAMVGQYHGPTGSAAMAVIAPIWNILYSLGLLTGIGGAILFSNARGKGADEDKNQYFTVSLLLTIGLSLLAWVGVSCFDKELMLFFGADEETLPYTLKYLHYIKFVVPVYLFNQSLACFLRNDNAPMLATIGIVGGAVFNIWGDYFFVFQMDMGIEGAGLATAMGGLISTLVLCSHFFTRKNTMRVVRIERFFPKCGEICINGFSTFFIDVAMGILTMLFNRQIMAYIGQDALSVYSILIQLSTFVQCCAYSVGESAQPLMSINLGASHYDRVLLTMNTAVKYAAAFGLCWLGVILVFPDVIIRLFMQPTESVMAIAPTIMRTYGLSFLLLPINVASTFMFQSLLKSRISFIISVGRGMVLSGLLILLLPAIFPAFSIWYAMVITEIIIFIYVLVMLLRCEKELKEKATRASEGEAAIAKV